MAAAARGEASPDNWIYGGVAAEMPIKAVLPATKPLLKDHEIYFRCQQWIFDSKWRADYEGISRTNNTLKDIAKIPDLADDVKKNLIGQAKFLRAHYYFDLKKMFNNVPYLDETTTNVNLPNNTDIWPKIEADFQYAYANLPNTQTAQAAPINGPQGRTLLKPICTNTNMPRPKLFLMR